MTSRPHMATPYATPPAMPRGGTGTMQILRDDDIDRVPLTVLIAAIRAHIVADAAGDASAPPRHVTEMDRGVVSLTVGGSGGYAGFRAYETFHAPQSDEDQIVAGWDTGTGRLFGMALGQRLGALRTGCIGGVALDVMTPRRARTLALIGTGQQAETQLAAALAVRDFADVRIYSRRPVAANELARRYRRSTNGTIGIAGTPEEAVHKADVVILATSATQPVIDADWVAPHAHVTTIGPKAAGRHELPVALARRARAVASDSPQQIRAMKDHFLEGEAALKKLKHLGALADTLDPDRDRGMTLFLSAGLAGTEVAALRAAIDHLAAR